MKEDGSPVDDFEAIAGYDGTTFWFEQGYRAVLKIYKTEAGDVHPHPYRRAFTLHAPSGRRIRGFDNAHPIERKAEKFKRRSPHADHWHRDARDTGRPYDFLIRNKPQPTQSAQHGLQGAVGCA